jgi:iron complex transport system ATP-binding protein
VVELAARQTWWQPVPAGRAPLWSPEPGGWEPGLGALGELVHQAIIEQHLRPLAAAVRRQVRVARGLLWGNAASALVCGLRVLATARPPLAETATRLTQRLLATEPLAGAGTLVQPDPDHPAVFFIRRSCCLFYRTPGGTPCGDCALLDPAGRQARWRTALARQTGPTT